MMNNAIAGSWEEWEREDFTPEEIAESDLRVELMGELIRARQEHGISQKKLEELSGVTQPVIARLERGTTSPNISAMLKLLAPLGKTRHRPTRSLKGELTYSKKCPSMLPLTKKPPIRRVVFFV